jgi:hypothetical protein
MAPETGAEDQRQVQLFRESLDLCGCRDRWRDGLNRSDSAIAAVRLQCRDPLALSSNNRSCNWFLKSLKELRNSLEALSNSFESRISERDDWLSCAERDESAVDRAEVSCTSAPFAERSAGKSGKCG